MSPSIRGSATDRIELDPDVLIRAGQRLTAVGSQLGLIADTTRPMLAPNGIASGWDMPGINFALEYADFGQALAPALAAAANSCKAVGLMLQASGHNYKNADAASTLPGGAPMGGVGETPPETVRASIPSFPNWIVVLPPREWAAIYPVIQFLGRGAMTWPLGNSTFMGVLAAQWDTISTGTDAFNDEIDAIKTVVSMQDIPERDRMLEDLQKIDDNLAELSKGASVLAGKIRDFAQGVEDTQNAIRRILDRVSSLDSVVDTVTGLFSGEALEIARDVVQVLRNFQRQVKGIVGLLNQAKQAINDALTAFQELNRRFLIATFGDEVGNTLADGFDHYTDFQIGMVNGLINTVAGTVAMLDADTWKGMYEVASQVADDPSKLDDVLLNMGKEFVVWDAWSGDHPGRAAGEAAFNIASLFNPYGGALSKTGTLAKGFRYGSTLAREGRLPSFSDLPGLGGRHTPTFEPPRGLPSAPEFRPAGVPESLVSPTAPGRFDPPTTPDGSGTGPGNAHVPPTPHAVPGDGDGGRGGGGGDDPPSGSDGRPVEPPDPGPRHNDGPATRSPTGSESAPPPGHSAPTPEAPSPGPSHGRVVAQSGADGVWAGRFTYADNGSGVTTTYTDGIGASTVYEFDGDLRPTAVASPAGAVVRTEFTTTRDPARSVDPTGATTTIAYTDDGLPIQVVDPLGRVTTMTYLDTPAGPRVAQMLDPAGGVVSFGYDAVGNRVSIRDADGGLWRWEYTATGAVSARVDPLGRRTEYRVNAAGLPVVVVEPAGGIMQLTYNVLGNLVAVVGPDGASTRMTYDAAGRMISRTAPDDATEYWAYDGEGNRVSHTDAAGATTRWEYGFFDLPVARIDADGSRTRFDYDSARRLRSVTNPAALTWSYRYNPDGTLAAQTDFNGATTSYTYDAARRVASRTNAAGQTVTFDYDAAGQVVAESSLGGDYSGERVEYTHDRMGRTTVVAMPESRISVDYDAVGRVVAEDFAGRRVVNEYNAAGELVGRTTPSGVRSELSYDGAGALDGLVTAGTPCAVGGDAYGRAARMQFGAAAIDSVWDAAGRLVRRRVLRTAGTDDVPVAAARFAYDPVGSLTSVSAADPAAPVLGIAAVYGTDVVGRLVSRRTANAVEQTAFDASQNATVTEGGEQSRWLYRGTLLIDDGRSRYRYDEAGRVVQVVTRRLGRRPDVWEYRWDAWDRLRSVTTPDRRVHHYTYDPAGRRLSKRTDDDRIDFTWAGDRMVEQTTAATTTSWSYQPGQISPYARHPMDGSRHSSNRSTA